MSKSQLFVLSLACIFFSILYFGFDTKPETQQELENTRALNKESTSINSLLMTAKKELKPENAQGVLLAEAQLDEAKNDSTKVEAYKALSSAWYQISRFAIAGFYAEKVAEVKNTDLAWSITGATYNKGMNLEKEEKVKEYCTSRAIQAFENAISLNPSNATHKVNLAVCYTERPPEGNPMKGVKMLLDISKKNPDNIAVLTSLGRFGMQTGQFEKAVARLEKALQIAPNNIKVNCLLAQAYEGVGQKEKAKTFNEICQSLAEAQ